ncbi:MAG TPA: gamma-glutamyl-gamma-aminobutyrate hydrolase family protein [Candidatus Acidoferrales bacterium]
MPANPRILALRHVAHEHLGLLARIAEGEGMACEYVDWFTERDKQPEWTDADAVAVVFLGGPMNVDDTEHFPFLAREQEIIQQAVRRKIPVLGICLGAQLIARALGARVYPAGVKEIGWHAVETTPAAAGDPLFKHFRPVETVFHWHGDTVDLPEGATFLARSDRVMNQAFRYMDFVWGIQFHVEVTTKMVTEWVEVTENAREIQALSPDVTAAKILEKTPLFLPRLHDLGRATLGEYVRRAKAL